MAASSTSFPDRGPSVKAVTTTTLVIASVFVAARLVSRIGIVRNVTLDDYFIVLAWFLAFGLSFAIDYGTSKGLGRYDADIPPQWDFSLRRSEYAFSVLYNPALMAAKSSILIFYLRLSRNTNKLLRIASYVTLGVVNVAGIVLTFLSVFQCRPVSAVFDPTNTSASCIPLVTLYLSSAPVNLITDLAILVLPIPVLTGMNLPQKQKIILVCTFALGIFVAIVDVIRIYYLQQASIDRSGKSLPNAASRLGGQADFAYYASLALMWTAVEVNVGIICACIPTLKPLFSRILPKLIHDRTQNDTDKDASFTSPIRPPSDREASPPVAPTITAPKTVRPVPQHQDGANQEQEMGMMDFLTTPGMDPSAIKRTETAVTRANYQAENTVYFGFVNMKKPQSMLQASGSESLKYCTIVTILFFLWGFSYGLLNTLNAQIAVLSHSNTATQSLGLQTAYFGAYLIGPLTVGRYVLIHGGFKATFITGLCIYGTGTLMFWPSAVLTSFPGFVVSNLVVAFGLSVLETAANPFIALCGPPDYAEMRLLLAQGVQGVGSVLSPLLAQKVLFKDVHNGFQLIDVQWTYLAIALFDVILALFFYYMPLPEASDDDLQAAADGPPQLPRHNMMTISRHPTSHSQVHVFNGIFNYKVVGVTLVLAVLSQLLYVAAQESVSINIEPLIAALASPPLSPFNTSILGHTSFALGRFLFAFLCLFILPRYLILASYLLATLFAILVAALPTTTHAPTVTAMALLHFVFEGPLFPLIFAIALRKLGSHTKTGAACLVAAASGGAWFPWVMYGAQKDGESVKTSFVVVIALLAAGAIFPVYLCAIRGAREQVDPFQGEDDQFRRPGSGRSGRMSLKRKKRKVGSDSNAGDERAGSDGPTVEHRERRSWESK